jgi:hypothetical protein
MIYLAYISIILLSILIIFQIYIRVKYRFWSTQPVFHVYDLKYYLFPSGIISPELPDKTKFYNPSIKFSTISSLSLYESDIFCNFIRNHYLQTDIISYSPLKENIAPYFEGHNNKSYISIKYENEMLINSTTNVVTNREKIVSCMTSRPLFCEIFPKSSSPPPMFEINYVDYLCVDNSYRGKGLASETIYTHEYNTQRQHNKVPVSLFKREDTIMGIVPLCTYDSIGFDMRKWTKLPDLQENIGKIVLCDASNYYLINDFISEIKTQFDIYISSFYGNIIELMKTQNIYIYMFIDTSGKLQSVYFFRNSCTWYDNNSAKSLNLFASIKNKTNNELFAHGCKIAITKIVDTHKDYVYFLAENISNNDIIIDNLKQKSPVVIQSPTSYFFYNFACNSFNSNKVLLIN